MRNDTPLITERWRKYDCVFDAQFWSSFVSHLWQDLDGDVAALRQHIVIVPDTSMYTQWSSAWVDFARTRGGACVIPRMMTLLDWAKSHGASDWDSGRTERIILWMNQLQNTPQLLAWLAGADESDVFAIASSMVDLSDELSFHLLAGQAIVDGEVALSQAIDTIYNAQSQRVAHQELEVLLQCWHADVAQQTPVVRYLKVLAALTQQIPAKNISVVRNRPWTRHEEWFWRAYSERASVNLFDITKVQALHDATKFYQAWPMAQDRIVASLKNDELGHRTGIVHAADHFEDEAQAAVLQVIKWRTAGLKKIALVALDRTVSRRVWVLLERCGIVVRDDTGWLLSTARSASSWQQGFELWSGEVQVYELLDWLMHPLVLSHYESYHKEMIRRYIKELAYLSSNVLRDWNGWLSALHRIQLNIVCHDGFDVYAAVIELIQMAAQYQKRFAGYKTLAQWVELVYAWASDFGMYEAWRLDSAGKVWLGILESWRSAFSSNTLSFLSFIRVAQNTVERATFRPNDVSDEVLLLPLGSTRMRDFEAVWLLGADTTNLPKTSTEVGLLNVSTRLALGLPTYLEQNMQSLRDLIDLFARTPILYASYCITKDGAPNALSIWLVQWLRVTRTRGCPIKLPVNRVEPLIASRSYAVVSNAVPSTLSATDLVALVACPYQFYVRKVLQVRNTDLPSDVLQSVDKGNWWHRILAAFHVKRVRLGVTTRESDIECLIQCVSELKPLCRLNARYWVVHEMFLSYVPAYVDWWRAREHEDWRVSAGEVWKTAIFHVDSDDGARFLLQWQGKIDQIDIREYYDSLSGQKKQEYALIDYKTGNMMHYQRDIGQGNDIQLAFYLNLMEEHQCVAQAGYVGVSGVGVKTRKKEKAHQGTNDYPQAWLNLSQHTHSTQELSTTANNLKKQVLHSFAQMHAGEPLVAMGELSACQWCSVRGLCRKGYTSNQLRLDDYE